MGGCAGRPISGLRGTVGPRGPRPLQPTSRRLAAERPQLVLLAAAKVGGILANDSAPGPFLHDNLAIQTNVIHGAWKAGVEKLVFLGSSCVYPKAAPQPMGCTGMRGRATVSGSSRFASAVASTKGVSGSPE